MSPTACYRVKLLIVGMVILLMVSACASNDPPASSQPPEGTFPVESVFREFYNLLGGEKTLGYAISPLIETGSIEMQYTEGALLRYDAQASAVQKFSLAPVGDDLHLADQPLVLPDQTGVRIVDGYIIYDDFVQFYTNLQAERFVGKPLTQVHVDAKSGRIEQYFENLGFYRLMSDPPNQVHLLSYGIWKCDAYCHYTGKPAARVAPQPGFPEPFISSLSRLGEDFISHPLSAPYIASDGMLEQIYENFIVAANPGSISLIGLRPITAQLGIPSEVSTDLVAKNEDPRMVFYPIKPGMGHNVPKIFEDYITTHGGLEIAGMPTTELFPMGSAYRQCFTNICLDYDPSAESSQRIRPVALGVLYLKQTPPPQATEANPSGALTSLHLIAWEDHALIPSDQTQVIHLKVTASEDQAPAAGIVAYLTIDLPGGSQAAYHFQPTGSDGQAALEVPPASAPNGTLVPYQVCVNPAAGSPQCVKESYVIWGNP